MIGFRPRVLLTFAIAVIFLVAEASGQSFRSSRWLSDFKQLREAMAENYANLDWAIEKHGIDPVALSTETEAAIASATSTAEALAALEAFLATFKDPHLEIASNSGGSGASLGEDEAFRGDTNAALMCRLMGFEDTNPEGFNFGLLDEYWSFAVFISQNNVFSAGIIDADGRQVGYLRIPSFRTLDYPGACQRAWNERYNTTREPCDSDCINTLIEEAIPAILIGDVARHLGKMTDNGVSRVVIDVTDNGGGNSWSWPVARLVGGAPVTCPVQRVPRNRDWRRRFEAARKDLRRDLKDDWPLEAVGAFTAAQTRLETLIAETKATCRKPEKIWTDPEAPACARLTERAYSACGALDNVPASDISAARSAWAVFSPSLYGPLPDVTVPPSVFVTINDGSASSTELFAAALQDAGAATIIGEQSWGAGCGHVGDSAKVALRRSGLVVKMPNCQRLRASGANEVDGITPDRPVNWPDLSSAEAKQVLLDAVFAAN